MTSHRPRIDLASCEVPSTQETPMTRPDLPAALGQLRTYWNPATDVTYVDVEEVLTLLQERTFCWVHDTPPVSDEEQALIDHDIDSVCIPVVRVA